MKKVFLFLLLCILSLSNAFAQIKLIKGIVKSDKDSSVLASSLVILWNDYYYEGGKDDPNLQKSFYHIVTDSTGRFELRDLVYPGITMNDTMEEASILSLRVFSNYYDTYYQDVYVTNDTLELELYLHSLYFVEEDTSPPAKPAEPEAYGIYGGLLLLGGSQFDASAYRFNYKAGLSYNRNYRIFKSNYLGWELSPILYRRSYTKKDTLATATIYPSEYYASIQSGLYFYARTHLFSWDRKRKAFFMDLGVEYNLPWHYWYIGKPDGNTKYTLKNFHKFNELYLNGRIGIIKGLALKGQYRLTDIFKSGFTELPRWSVELQAIFFIEWD